MVRVEGALAGRRLLAWVCLLIVLPRAAFMAALPNRSIYGNATALLQVAENVGGGRGFVDERGQPEGYFGPVYVWYVAAAQVLAGEHALLLVKLGHIAFDVITGLVLCAVMTRYLSRLGLLAVAVALAFHPLLIHYVNNVNHEPLLTMLVAVAFAASVRAAEDPSGPRFVMVGVACALATLVKGTPILLPLAIVAALLLPTGRERMLRWSMVLLVAYCAALSPWSYRNYEVLGRFSPTVGGLGSNLWWGSDPRIFTSYGDAQRAVATRAMSEARSNGLVSHDASDVFARERQRLELAIQNYRDLARRPGQLLKVLALKAARTLYATEDRPSAHKWIALIQIPLWIMAAIGFWVVSRSAPHVGALLIAFVGYFYVVVAAGMPMIRYFVPALPLLLLAATLSVPGAAVTQPRSPSC